MTSSSEVIDFVSRETNDKLLAFVELLRKWNPHINLVSKGELDRIWQRHVLDSTQLFPLASQRANKWLDIGSGGGFPGIICAILASEISPAMEFHLVESDNRKAIFLRQASDQLSLATTIHPIRVEQLNSGKFDIVTARALASLERLLGLAQPHSAPDTQMIFPKGKTSESELTEALMSWHMEVERIPSQTDPDGVIFKISKVRART